METGLVLTRDMVLVLGLVGFTIAMFMFERIRADATALVVLVLLGLTGLVPANQLFDGFSGNAVMSVIATMILLTSTMAGVISGFMQNPSVMALFLPVAARVSGRSGISLSRLLLPMAAAIVMGSGLTMIGNSPLMLLNDLLVAANRNLPSGAATLKPLPMFAPLPIGIALLIAGLAYFRWLGPRFLGRGEDKGVAPSRTQSYFARTYGIEGDVFELSVTAESPLVGMSVGEAEAQRDAPLLLALLSGNEARLAPPADQMIWVGSVLGVMGPREAIQDYAQKNLLRMSGRLRNFADLFNPSRSGISEAVIPPNSTFIGKAQEHLQLRKRFGISLLAINRDNQVWREDIRRMPMKAGDMLVFHSIWTDLAQASESRDFVVVTDYPKGEHRPQKLWWALTVFVAAMALALTTLVPVPIALMTGAAGMMIAGVLNMDEAYSAVSWKTVFLMACLIPLGWAMDSSGAAGWIAQEMLERIGPGVPLWVLQAAIGLLATAFALVIGNVGATVVMVPMAINVALAAGGSPLVFALVVALSASNNFLSVSNPVLAMVTGPAGYRSRDLWRTGAPLTLVYLSIVLVVVNLVF